jgi:hypothetical protein
MHRDNIGRAIEIDDRREVLERVLALGGVLARASPAALPGSGALGDDAMQFEVVRAGFRQ